ncbi:GDSL esterase/lipase [Prunus yedoensis var. nudiflora]|uniref:GDSL esterase/lipase n=1 Tax=Prunus yedoensis var. nudiflora TaxID=2094558 RepID=A0A314YBV6_PRUYE|nr:GDSL esterase/lipase [Prunus yedoensis var. nudiflora]PQQ02390.1 GDSL esterase/lipase [Prunus yedoensis var. nudiflora]
MAITLSSKPSCNNSGHSFHMLSSHMLITGLPILVMKNPNQYGFKESFKACCGTGDPYNFEVFPVCGTPSASAYPSPSQYINWDGVHLTEAMYKVHIDMFLNARPLTLASVTCWT